jgi:dynactin complex subunit
MELGGCMSYYETFDEIYSESINWVRNEVEPELEADKSKLTAIERQRFVEERFFYSVGVAVEEYLDKVTK